MSSNKNGVYPDSWHPQYSPQSYNSVPYAQPQAYSNGAGYGYTQPPMQSYGSSGYPNHPQQAYHAPPYAQPTPSSSTPRSYSRSNDYESIKSSYGGDASYSGSHASYHQQSRPRSHSQSHVPQPYHAAPQSPTLMSPVNEYPTQVPLGLETNPAQYDYSASASKPYSCDLCTLAFSRQHDLRRHRDTHRGDKPFTCNGGCGKTFTRKDALKRHQLVKKCGKPEADE